MVNNKIFYILVFGIFLVGFVCSTLLLDFTETFTGVNINSTRFANLTTGNFSISQNGFLIIQNLTANSSIASSKLTEKQANINLSRNFTITLSIEMTDTTSTLDDGDIMASLISINSSLTNSSMCGIIYVVDLGDVYTISIYNSSITLPDVPPVAYSEISGGIGNVTMTWNTNTKMINCSFYNGTNSVSVIASDENLFFQNNSQLNLMGYIDGMVGADTYNFSTPLMTYAGAGYGSGADNGNARVCTSNNSANCVSTSIAAAVNQITTLDGISNFSLCLYNTTTGRSVLVANTTFSSNADCVNYVGNVTGIQPTFVNLTMNNVWNATVIRGNYTIGMGAGLTANIAPFPPYLNFSHTSLGSSYYSTFDNLVFAVSDNLVPEIISFVSPGVTVSANRSINNIPVNISSTDDYLIDSILIRLYNSSKAQINSSLQYFGNVSASSKFFNFTSLSDGVYYVNATVNDTSNHVNDSITLNIILDVTAPTLTLEKSSSTLSAITFVTTCVDVTSGINGGCLTVSSTSGVVEGDQVTGLGCGTTVTVTLNASDYAGNTAQTSTDMATSECSSSSSGGGGGTPSFWTNTFVIDATQFNAGYSKDTWVKNRFQFKLGTETHHVGIKSVSLTSAVIEVASTPQEFTMNVGEEKKFDLNTDGYYDLSVRLNSITNGKVNVNLKGILEKVSVASNLDDAQNQDVSSGDEQNELGQDIMDKSLINYKLWISLAVLVVIFVLIIILLLSRHRKKKKK
ncbi:hypothetical protein J4474_03430 [Candidatus Pacearchaeota archaeon]|nr:hypothetical protein [Candidatus Pacearchaeota archaeon]